MDHLRATIMDGMGYQIMGGEVHQIILPGALNFKTKVTQTSTHIKQVMKQEPNNKIGLNIKDGVSQLIIVLLILLRIQAGVNQANHHGSRAKAGEIKLKNIVVHLLMAIPRLSKAIASLIPINNTC